MKQRGRARTAWRSADRAAPRRPVHGGSFDAPCPRCGAEVEFFPDDDRSRCPGCGRPVPNPRPRVSDAPGLRSIRLLRQDHHDIERALSGLERAARAALDGGAVDEEAFGKAFGSLRREDHQAGEETLAHLMERKGFLGARAPLAEEHGESRAFLSGLLRIFPQAVRGEPAARRMLAENALAYVGFFRSHMREEERVVYAAADQQLSDDDDRELLTIFSDQRRRASERANDETGG